MKTLVKLALSICMLTSIVSGHMAMAAEPKATLCSAKAIEAATALFLINAGQPTKYTVGLPELVDMNHAEGGTEVWDVGFKADGVTHGPYRMTLEIDACTAIAFEIVSAG